jgi:hypothetical protein
VLQVAVQDRAFWDTVTKGTGNEQGSFKEVHAVSRHINKLGERALQVCVLE